MSNSLAASTTGEEVEGEGSTPVTLPSTSTRLPTFSVRRVSTIGAIHRSSTPNTTTALNSKRRSRPCCRCRIPALTIFVLCALLCTIIAGGAGVAMYFFTINILEDSVKREGANQADAIGARVSALFDNVEKSRNVTIGHVMAEGSYFDSNVANNADIMRGRLNDTFGLNFLSEAVNGRVQGMEVACLLPSGISENEDATGFAIVSIYSEVLKSGSRVFTRMISDAVGRGFTEYYIEFPDPTAPKSELMASAFQGRLRSQNDSDVTFVDGYQSDYSDSDYFYFDGFVGPDGFGYFYATSYRYFFAGSYLCEVSAYQLVDSWYTFIQDSLKDAPDTQIAIVDGVDEYVLASTFASERERISECYPNVTEYWLDDDGACIKKSFRDLTDTPKLQALVSSVYSNAWAELDLDVPTSVSKETIDNERYFIVVKQLGNTNYLRPFLIWARPVEAVISDLRRTTIIIVVCSSSAILVAMLFVAGCTAFMLLRPMKALEEKMQRLTRMEEVSLGSFTEPSDMDSEEDFELLEKEDEDCFDDEEVYNSGGGVSRNRQPGGRSTAFEEDPSADYSSTVSAATTDAQRLQQDKNKHRSGGSFIREVGDLQYHFNAMGRALHSFTKYVPRDVVNELMLTGQVATSGMKERRLTIMFVDIAGFTTICESLNNPSIISKLLTKFFSVNTSRLHAHGATVDKFIGDCIMCFWGAPIRIDNPNFRALCAGLDLQRTARELNSTFLDAGASLEVRVGCHTGHVLVGNIGSDDRINYTAMGDAVNSASRLEGANKRFSSSFLASEEVLKGSRMAQMFATRFVGELSLKGKHNKVISHHICGTTMTASGPSFADSQHHHQTPPTLSPQLVSASGRDQGAASSSLPLDSTTVAAVTRLRAGTHSLGSGYDSVARYCYVSPNVATACVIFGLCIRGSPPPFSSLPPSTHQSQPPASSAQQQQQQPPHGASASFSPPTTGLSQPHEQVTTNPLIPISNFDSDLPPNDDIQQIPSATLQVNRRGGEGDEVDTCNSTGGGHQQQQRSQYSSCSSATATIAGVEGGGDGERREGGQRGGGQLTLTPVGGDLVALDNELAKVLSASHMYIKCTDDNGAIIPEQDDDQDGGGGDGGWCSNGSKTTTKPQPPQHNRRVSYLRAEEQDYATVASIRADLRRRLIGGGSHVGADGE